MFGLVFGGVTALAKLATSKKHAQIRTECTAVLTHIQEQIKKHNDNTR
jgi:hypothetical protein